MGEPESISSEETWSEIEVKEEPLDSLGCDVEPTRTTIDITPAPSEAQTSSSWELANDQNSPVLEAIEFATVNQEESIGNLGEALKSQEEQDPLAIVDNVPPQVETNSFKRKFILIKVNVNGSVKQKKLKCRRSLNLANYKNFAEIKHINKVRIAPNRTTETEEQYRERLRRDQERKIRQRIVERSINEIYIERLKKDRERTAQKRAQLTRQKRIERLKKDREYKRLKRLEFKVQTSKVETPIQKSFHKEDRKYVCDVCKLLFNSEELFKKHLMHFHGEKFSCNYCGVHFSYLYDLVEHELVHTDGKKPFKCAQCHSEHTSLGTLLQHFFKKHKMRVSNVKCEICDQIFSSQAYKAHCRIHAEVSNIKDKTHNQSHDEISNVNDKSLRQSRGEISKVNDKTLRQSRGEISKVNDKTLRQSRGKISKVNDKTLRQSRGEISNSKTPILCEVCGKMLKTSGSFKDHQRTHTGEKPFACEECGKCFTTKLTLHFHRRVHTGFKPYKCNECGKAFAQRSPLVTHTRMHTGERPYGCTVCGLGFLTSSILRRHMRQNHSKLEK